MSAPINHSISTHIVIHYIKNTAIVKLCPFFYVGTMKPQFRETKSCQQYYAFVIRCTCSVTSLDNVPTSHCSFIVIGQPKCSIFLTVTIHSNCSKTTTMLLVTYLLVILYMYFLEKNN